jgi:hypothetical protein
MKRLSRIDRLPMFRVQEVVSEISATDKLFFRALALLRERNAFLSKMKAAEAETVRAVADAAIHDALTGCDVETLRHFVVMCQRLVEGAPHVSTTPYDYGSAPKQLRDLLQARIDKAVTDFSP